jgi:hypothetical protein
MHGDSVEDVVGEFKLLSGSLARVQKDPIAGKNWQLEIYGI